MNIVILGLSITSSWGNGHATTFRALTAGLRARGHDVLFLERNVPWYAAHRDLEQSTDCGIGIYEDLRELTRVHLPAITAADLVIVGSFVPDGIAVADLVLGHARGVTAYYDIDTPVTLAAVESGASPHLAKRQMPRFDLYLSFTGGDTLERLSSRFGVRRPRAFYCSVDPARYRKGPQHVARYDLGYLGTYSADRQPALERLLIEPARSWPEGRFVIAGAQYPSTLAVPVNVEKVAHVPPPDHATFYNQQRFTLNVTRRDMVQAGHAPSVRLFEAAGCGTPIISDEWPGLGTILTPGREILIAHSSRDVLAYVRELSETERVLIGMRAQQRILTCHTSVHRAIELERHVRDVAGVSPETDRLSA